MSSRYFRRLLSLPALSGRLPASMAGFTIELTRRPGAAHRFGRPLKVLAMGSVTVFPRRYRALRKNFYK
jgi:hypothetical protein